MGIPLTIIDGTFTRDGNLLEYTVKEDGGDEWDLRAHAWESDGKFHGVVIIKGHARQPYAEGDTIDDMALKLAEQVIAIKRHLEEEEERAEQARAHSRVIVDERERNMEPYHGFTSSVSPEIVGGKQWTDPLTGHLWTYAGDYGWFDEDTLEDLLRVLAWMNSVPCMPVAAHAMRPDISALHVPSVVDWTRGLHLSRSPVKPKRRTATVHESKPLR